MIALRSRATLHAGGARVHPPGHRRHRARRHGRARAQSLATANIVSQPAGKRSHGRRRGRHRGAAAARRRSSTSGAASRVRDRVLEDPLLRGDLVSEDGTVTAIVVTFDEDRIDDVRGEVIDRIHDADRPAPAGRDAGVLQRQHRDQRDLQPGHAVEPDEAHAADPAADDRRALRDVPIVARSRCWSWWRSSSASSGRWACTC